jgi:hypothetical protein
MSQRSSNGSMNNNMNFQQINQSDSINYQTINKDKNFIQYDNQNNNIQNSIQINNAHTSSTHLDEKYINYETV